MRKKLKPEKTFWTKAHSYPPTTLGSLQSQIFQNAELERNWQMIELLSVETRLRILFLLTAKKNICVGDMADVLRLGISAVSHQLSVLKRNGLVEYRRRGKVIYYSLGKNLPELVQFVLNTAAKPQS